MNFKSNFSKVCKTATSANAFTLYSVVGLAATVFFTVKATKKYCETEKVKRPTVKDVALTYAPVAASTVVTVCCIKKANSKARDAINLINNAYHMSENKFNRYKDIATGAIVSEVCKGVEDCPPKDEDKEWFFDEYSQRYFESTEANVAWAEYDINRNFQLRGGVSLNEFYAFLGLDPIDIGDTCGWIVEDFWEGGLIPWIDFSHRKVTDDEGRECTIIGFTWDPEFPKGVDLLWM